MPFLPPNQQRQSTEGNSHCTDWDENSPHEGINPAADNGPSGWFCVWLADSYEFFAMVVTLHMCVEREGWSVCDVHGLCGGVIDRW